MISILLPTLGERVEELKRLFQSLENQTEQDFELVIVSQDNHEKVDDLIKEYNFKYKHIKIETKGLSVSRNIGMKSVAGDKVILSDDDAWYPDTTIEEIKSSLKEEQADILCFQIYDPFIRKLYKNYECHKKNVQKRQLLKKSSIEICIDLDKVDKKKVCFDENFGLGAKYISGEENLLLNKLISDGHICRYVPKVIVYHRKKENFVFDKKYVESKAMLFKILFGKVKAFALVNLLLIKKYKNMVGDKAALFKRANEIIFMSENMEGI